MTPQAEEVDTNETRSGSHRAGRIIRLGALLAVMLSLVLAVTLASRFGTDPKLVDSPLIGRPAPDVVLPDLIDEAEMTLKEMSGSIVVVNFWASWCVACRAEHDDLISTAEAFEDRGVRFVGVVYQDDPKSATAFLDEIGWGENYDYVTDPGSRAAISFGVFGIPETFFINRDGIIVGKISGESNALLLGSTLDEIIRGGQPGDQTTGTIQSQPDE